MMLRKLNPEIKQSLHNIVMDLLIKYGADGHIDGSEEITDFIESMFMREEFIWLQENLPKESMEFSTEKDWLELQRILRENHANLFAIS